VLQPQDIVLPALETTGAHIHFLRITQFIDELLIYYNQKPFYQCKTYKQLVGHYVLGLAPHTSVGMLGRIIGFSQTSTLMCHPFFHAALRRDCDGDEASILLLTDVLLNFSLSYVPTTRGSKMDLPLVIQTLLDPTQVDDMVGKMENVNSYSLN